MRVFLVLFFFCINVFSQVTLDPLVDYKYCGFVPRLANGDIKRRADVLTAFKKIHPCPSTGLTTGSCPGWAIDHSLPISCGGCDAVRNLTWMPDQIKSCKEWYCKDRYERKIYANNPPAPDSNNCVNKVIDANGIAK